MIFEGLRFDPSYDEGIEQILSDSALSLIRFAHSYWRENIPELMEWEDTGEDFYYKLEERLSDDDFQLVKDLRNIRMEIDKRKHLAILHLGMKIMNR